MDQRCERKFIIYPVDIVKFVQYIRAFGVEENAVLYYCPQKNDYSDEDNVMITGGYFLATVLLYPTDVVKFHNIFVLMFSISKPIVIGD